VLQWWRLLTQKRLGQSANKGIAGKVAITARSVNVYTLEGVIVIEFPSQTARQFGSVYVVKLLLKPLNKDTPLTVNIKFKNPYHRFG